MIYIAAAIFILSVTSNAYALDLLKIFTHGETSDIGAGGLPMPDDRFPTLYDTLHPAYLGYLSSGRVGARLEQQNTARINEGAYSDTLVWDNNWYFSLYTPLPTTDALNIGGFGADFTLDRSYAHLVNDDLGIDGIYRSRYRQFRAGYGITLGGKLSFGAGWLRYAANGQEINDFNFEVLLAPREEISLGYRQYSDDFYLDISAILQDKKALLPIAYRKLVREIDLRAQFEGLFSFRYLQNLRETFDRALILGFDGGKLGKIEGMYRTRRDNFWEGLLDEQQSSYAYLNIDLLQEFTAISLLYPIDDDTVQLTYQRGRFRTDNRGETEGKLIQQTFLDFDDDVFDFVARADISIKADSYAIGWRANIHRNFTYQLGFQAVQIVDEGGRYSYRVLSEEGLNFLEDGEALYFKTINLGIFTGGLSYRWGPLELRYALAQYFPLDIDTGRDKDETTTQDGGGGKTVRQTWLRALWEKLAGVTNKLKEYQGGNYHKAELVFHF